MLAPWVSSCEVNDRTIFLDVRRNRYSTMKSSAATALLEQDPTNVPAAILRQVENWGWLVQTHCHDDFASTPIVRAMEELSAYSRDQFFPRRLIAAAIRSIVITKCRLAFASLECILEHVTITNSRVRAGNGASIEALVAAFEFPERILLGSKSCLVRSIALQGLLADHGHRSTLVFGVRLNPFRAHCWLQSGTVLLNDTIEQVGLFEPLRAVE